MAANAGGIRAGKAYVEVSADSNALSRGLKLAEKKLRAFGSSVQAVGARFAQVGAGITAMGGAALTPFVAAVKASADFNEAVAKTQVVFGDSAKVIIGQSEAMAKQFGVSKQEYVDAATSFGAVFKGLGKSQAEAAALGNQLAQLGMDMASFSNTSNADAFTALQAALRGEFDPLERFTVFLSAAKIENKALAMGLAKTKGEITDQAKKMATLAEIMGQTADAQGDLARTSGSLSNQIKEATGRVKNMAVDVGSALAPAVAELLGHVNRLLQPIGEWIKANPQLIRTVAMVAAGVVVAGAAIAGLGIAIVGIGATISAVGTILGTLGALAGALVSPIGLVIAALAGLTVWFFTATDAGGKALSWLGDRFRDLKDTAVTAFKGMADALRAGDIALAGKILWLSLKMEWQKGINFLNEKWQDWSTATKEVFAGVSFALARAMTDAWAGVKVGFVEAVDFMKDGWAAFMGFLQQQWNNFGGFFRKVWVRIKAMFSDKVDVGAEVERINKDVAAKNAAVDARRDKAIGGRMDARKETLGGIEGDRQAAQAAIDDQQQARIDELRKAAQASIAAGDAKLAQLQSELAAALAEARRKAGEVDAAKDKDVGKPPAPPKFEMAGLTPAGLDAAIAGVKTDVKGTFNAAAIRGLGADSVQDKQLEQQKLAAASLKKIVKQNDERGRLT